MAAPIGNRYSVGNKGGRPPAYANAEELQNEVMAFFEYCKKEKIKSTVTGLTLYLGFQSRSSLDDYVNTSEEFSYIIKRAKLAVENSYELHGQTIDIFALKNMGWRDKTEHGFTNSDGADVPIQIIQLPSNGRDNTAGEPEPK